ncbi:ParB/RepB/Spo0J family partition protein [Oligoflexus tunisiensis]|uniref:ParB/RepB/Spo0J family partition protein n=1 Tax=Oligoflexus tunisiensis TaxID=708132 RepID=UPI001C4082CB|nr:ParB/RepB/Spo0J family partition protein [Oligoflexus tunisiensis]
MAKKNLDKMVKGAAREVNTSRPSRESQAARPAASKAPTAPAASEARRGASAAEAPAPAPAPEPAPKPSAAPSSVFEQLQAQIERNGKTIQKVPVENIKLNENIREAYNQDHLKVLAESMQKDGLIQFPTLCLKTGVNGEFSFVCKNGHRRILAAKMLGWKTIECVILPFASTRDELYHTIAANLREDVFYLDLSQAYQQANHLGESDQAIAERVGVNPRTVGWYRRLVTMAPECQALCRQHPDLFHATWAIQLARKGELPPLAILMKQMQFMLARHQAQKDNTDQAPQPDRLPKTIDVEQQKEARSSLKALFSGARGPAEAQQAWQLVEQLCIAGYFKPALLNRMRRQLLPGAQKASRRPSTIDS